MLEEDIINGCKNKNTASQQLLFNKYSGRLMGICLRYASDQGQAEDMLQEAFIKIFTKINQYNFQGSFEGWMKTVTVNNCLKSLKKRRIHFKELSESETDLYNNARPEVFSSLSEAGLMKMINNLPYGYKIVFNLYVIEGYDHKEIGRMLKIKPSTSRSQLIMARRLLQKQIISQQNISVHYDR